MRLFFWILFIAASCTFIDDPHFEVDVRLKISVDEFYRQAEIRGVNVSRELIVRVGDINSVGLFKPRKGLPVIIISRSFVESSTDSLALQYIVFHEMGHFMGRDHNTDFSIMNPNKYAGEYRSDFEKRVQLIDELFK